MSLGRKRILDRINRMTKIQIAPLHARRQSIQFARTAFSRRTSLLLAIHIFLFLRPSAPVASRRNPILKPLY